MRIAVIRFPGSDSAEAIAGALQQVSQCYVEEVWAEGSKSVNGFDALILPPGHSYGDHVRPGALAAATPLMAEVQAFADQGGLVIGFGNGAQILCEARLLPGAFLLNASTRFVCQAVSLRVETNTSALTRACNTGEILELSVAHKYGRYYVEPDTLTQLEANDQIVFRYAAGQGEASATGNPNGSTADVAGVANEQGNVLGLIAHPERCVDPALASHDGLKVFESIVAHLQGDGTAGRSVQ